jgi:hypothetical protein
VGFPPGGDPEVMAWAREVEGGGRLWAVTRETLYLEHQMDPIVLAGVSRRAAGPASSRGSSRLFCGAPDSDRRPSDRLPAHRTAI